jgi:hypothetical protein
MSLYPNTPDPMRPLTAEEAIAATALLEGLWRTQATHGFKPCQMLAMTEQYKEWQVEGRRVGIQGEYQGHAWRPGRAGNVSIATHRFSGRGAKTRALECVKTQCDEVDAKEGLSVEGP